MFRISVGLLNFILIRSFSRSLQGEIKFLLRRKYPIGSGASVQIMNVSEDIKINNKFKLLSFRNYSVYSTDESISNSESLKSSTSKDGADASNQISRAITALTELIEAKKSSNLIIEKRANIFGDLYRLLNYQGKKTVLYELACIWSCKQNTTLNSVKNYITAQDRGDTAVVKAEDKLRNTLAMDQGWLLISLARLEGGIKFLIDIRADILDHVNQLTVNGISDVNSEALKSLSNAIRDLIAPCFGLDLLKLERVTWSSPGNLLQNISEGEAVHSIRSWSDLKKRLGPYRRCFILSHQSLPLRPLAILHVALTADISSSIHSILNRIPLTPSFDSESENAVVADVEDTQVVNTAIFYSISSTQKGLAGIDLGQCLIKRAVQSLQAEIPNLTQFSTLSPVPGFRSWLLHQLREAERGRETMLKNCDWHDVGQIVHATDDAPPYGQVRQLLANHAWVKDESKVRLLEPLLMKLCAHYLFVEKRRAYALDSVANFHLRNGAVVWRINWLADLSPRGLKNSFGIMVNYRYFLEKCEDNSQAYVEKQHIECTEQILTLSSFANVSNLSRL